MKNDAEVERNQTPDTEQQTALKMAEDFLKTTPYLAVKLSKDAIDKRFGEEWENVQRILEEQGISVIPCAVYVYQPCKWHLLDACEEKGGYAFKPKRDEKGKILNSILRERCRAARVRADEFTSAGWIRANLSKSEMPKTLGEDWRIVLQILEEERSFSVKHYRVWKRYGFLGLKKELIDWKYLVTTPEAENSD